MRPQSARGPVCDLKYVTCAPMCVCGWVWCVYIGVQCTAVQPRTADTICSVLVW